jgi:lipopolysaccharide/colanic/teichoic acid biosynthesis glycosyltransferase
MLTGESGDASYAEAMSTVVLSPGTHGARKKHLGHSDSPAAFEGSRESVRPVPSLGGSSLLIKRAADVTIATAILVCISPVMIVIWLLVRLTSKGPAMYVQERIGFRGKPFNFYKFRTMYVESDDSKHREYVKKWMKNQAFKKGSEGVTFKIVNDSRVTPVGRILRRYSLDELPQFFNVLKLDMSMVGPRPALAYEIENYADWHKQRLQGIPGITGPWQVSGRNQLSFDEMVRLDIDYLRTWSLLQDLKLIAKTIPAVLSGNGN